MYNFNAILIKNIKRPTLLCSQIVIICRGIDINMHVCLYTIENAHQINQYLPYIQRIKSSTTNVNIHIFNTRPTEIALN